MPRPPDHTPADRRTEERLQGERWELLHHVQGLTEKPLIALSFVWLVLLIVDFTAGLSEGLQLLVNVIWVIFILDFLLRFSIAPAKVAFLRTNWLTALSLMLPALRILRAVRGLQALRFLRAARPIGLLRLLTSFNRGFRALGSTMRRRGLPYVLALTALLVVAGAAGMFFFEGAGAAGDAGFTSYWHALWWTAMLVTSLGSEYWPRTAEGRLLAFLLAVFSVTVFGYITASLASFFIGRDQVAEQEEAAIEASLVAEGLEAPGAAPASGAVAVDAPLDGATVRALLAEIAALRAELAARRGEQ